MTELSDWSGPPINVIGMGMETGVLSASARAALDQAELIIGSVAHLATLPEVPAEKIPYPSPMSGLRDLLLNHAEQRIALLASGDPLFYGIGSTLLRHFSAEHLIFHPNISSIQAAFARLGRPWQPAQMISLHGRPLASLRAALQGNRLYALLTDRENSPTAIAQLLVDAGFGESDLWVAEDLGMPEERFRHFQAGDLVNSAIEFSPLNVVIVETRGPGGIAGISRYSRRTIQHWRGTGQGFAEQTRGAFDYSLVAQSPRG
jgi:precorrin-6Y C5,15-methyltransferase (decarboxylating)